jgi:hypothetical protein
MVLAIDLPGPTADEESGYTRETSHHEHLKTRTPPRLADQSPLEASENK